ncbi:MAG TPA: helix-turn-helix domain-containing protein, partial [Candidatus Paceibacterota bacterium]|nr:helix-turn-helix domain-containing protein [Candidatus Paceibacterota bacterium]
MPELFQDTLHSTLIPTKVASEISGYNADYLARLCREKKIDGTQVGRSWLINRSSLEAFVAEQEDRKKQRAEDLRTQREKEYRRAQKPILKATLAKTADMRDVVTRSVAGGIATSRARAADFARTTRRSFAPKIHSSHEGYSPRLAALAVALAVVAGTAYASTDARILTALGTIPNTAVRIALRTSPSTLEHSASFRITEADAPTNIAESIPTVPNARDASRAVALLMPNANVAALSSVRDLTDAARGPFAQTNAAAVASARIASVSDIAAHPGASLIRAYVGAGESIYDIGATIANAYANGIATVGDRALARAATLRDGIAYVPHLTNALLDGYANGIYAWNDAASKAPAATMLALYTVGDSISARTAAVPTLALQEQKKIAYNAGETAHTGAVMLAAALAPSGNASNAPSSTQSPAIASVGALTKPFTGAYGAAVTAGGAILSLPVKAEDTILGVAGYASSLMDGTEAPASVASTGMNAPQVALAQETGSSANNVDASLPSAVSASAVSFLPASWQQAIGSVFHSVGTVASTFLSSAFHSLAFLFPNGSVVAPTLTVLHTGPTETLALPTPTGVAHGGGDLAISNDNRTIIQNVVNNYFPTGLVGGAFDSAVLAVVRPFVNDSIEASLKNNRGSGGSSSVTTSTGGVNSDGATLTNVTISSGNATVTALNASNSSLGTASATTFTAGTTTVGTTTVNGNLTITGTITAGSLSVGSLSYSGAVVAPSFQATDTAATSSFTTLEATKGVFTALTVGTDSFTSLLGNGLVNLGGFLSISTSSFSGSGSNFNADLLDGHDSTYLLANSFSTSSANAWMTSQTTDALAEGTLNQYFTNARARSALSVSGTGLSYASTTGIISVASGYSIPLTASTTDWNTAYLSRITVANAPLSILNNTLSLSQASGSTDGYLSSADFNTFNSKQAALTFTYPLVNTTNTISVAFGTSTSNTWGGTQIFTNAPVLGSLTGFLKATAGVLSTSLIDLSTDVSSTLPVSHGGTGSTSLTGLLKGNGTGSLLTAVDGTDYLSPSTFGSSFYTYFHATTTDALAQGSTNKYYSDTLARAAISNNAVGLTYTAGSGILSLTSGYSIPLTASTTEWSTFYATPSTRITAGTNLSWAGNTLNGPSDSYIHNLFSAASPLSYNAGTGAFTFSTSSISGAGSNLNADFLDGLDSTYFLANAFSTTSAAYWKTQNNFYSTTSADFWLTGKSTTNLAEGTNLYYTDARADARINATSTIGTLTSAPNLGTVKTTLTGILKATSGVLSNAVAGTDYENPLTFTYPLTRSTNTISLAFGTTTANSWSSLQTFSAGINVGASTFTSLLGTGLSNVGGALTVATSTFSGSGSLFNADLLDGLDSTYFLANAFSTTSAAYWKTQNNFYSTTSADFWLTGKSTTNLAEGTNLYYTDARADARINATSTIGTLTSAPNLGTVKTTLTGILKATSGVLSNAVAGTDYENPLTFTYPLQRTTNTISLAFGTTTANSWSSLQTFSAGINIGASTFTSLLGTGLTNVGGALTVATSTFSGSGSLFNADLLDGLDSTYFLANAFSTTSAAYWKTQNNFYSTTSADFWLTGKSTTNLAEGTNLYYTNNRVAGVIAGTTTDALAEGSVNKYYSDTLATANFVSNLAATTSVNSITTLANLSLPLTQTTGTLAQGRGGTGITSYTAGDILYADNSGNLAVLPVGATGQVLKVQAGLPSWGVDQTIGGGGSDGIFATSSGKIYPLDTANVLLVGTNATSTTNSIFEVNGIQYISSKLGIATTSPSAALSVAGNGLFSGTLTSGNIIDSGLTANSLLYADASKQLSSATLGTGLSFTGGALAISTSTFSGSGSKFNADLLDGLDSTYFLANAFGTTSANYWLTTKSTTDLAEGTNLYFTNARADARINATSTIG